MKQMEKIVKYRRSLNHSQSNFGLFKLHIVIGKMFIFINFWTYLFPYQEHF